MIFEYIWKFEKLEFEWKNGGEGTGRHHPVYSVWNLYYNK